MNRSTLRNAFILGIVTFVIAPVMMLLGVINFFSVDRTRGARENWEATLGSPEQLMQHYSATTANTSALELERLSAALGITISPRSTDRSQADPDAQKALKQMGRQVFSVYFAEQSVHVRRGDIDPPPTELTDYLEIHREDLSALRRHLLESDTPVWESDFSKMYAAPIPNLLGHINIQKLLAAVAMAQLHEGDRTEALETIHAAWSLSRSLRDSPVMISQLIYLGGTRRQVAALRHVPDLPDVWEERLTEHDFRASFLTAMKLEGWVWLHAHPGERIANHADPWASGAASGWLKRSAVRLVRPYVSLCMADISDKWRERVILLEQETTWCDRDLLEEGTAPPIVIPRWNHVGDQMLPNLYGATVRVARLELDQELLLQTIAADAARRETAGSLPTDVTVRNSKACPDDRWIFTPTPEGLEIALSREIEWPPNQQGPLLPLRALLN